MPWRIEKIPVRATKNHPKMYDRNDDNTRQSRSNFHFLLVLSISQLLTMLKMGGPNLEFQQGTDSHLENRRLC